MIFLGKVDLFPHYDCLCSCKYPLLPRQRPCRLGKLDNDIGGLLAPNLYISKRTNFTKTALEKEEKEKDITYFFTLLLTDFLIEILHIFLSYAFEQEPSLFGVELGKCGFRLSKIKSSFPLYKNRKIELV